MNKLLKILKLAYAKLFKINDTPQKISLGVGLGVALGIIPGTGPIAAICLAFLFRVNRAAALIGALLTNTWLSIIGFLLAVQAGSWIMKAGWQDIYGEWKFFLMNFSWPGLFKLSVLKILLAIIIGYVVIAAILGLIFYLATIIILSKIKKMPHKNE